VSARKGLSFITLVTLAAAALAACSSSTGPGGAAAGTGGASVVGGGTGGATVVAGAGGANGAGQASGGRTILAEGSGGAGTGGATSPAATGGSGIAGSGGTGGSAGLATGGVPAQTGSGGAPAPGTGGSVVGGAGGAVGAPTGNGGGTSPPQTFACSSVLGLMLTSQWYNAGFEQAPGIDNARWQLKWMEHAYIDEWANANSAFWDITPLSACAQGSSNPDRVVLVALSWTIATLADWESNVTKDVENIKAKYSNLKQIVLMTIVRGPGNTSCGNTAVLAENTLIPSYVDQALANVAAKYPTLVKVGPQTEAAACSDFMGTGPHLTTAGDTAAAKSIATFFAGQ
jgi:hypothetical protein